MPLLLQTTNNYQHLKFPLENAPGLDVDAVDGEGKCALQCAIRRGNYRSVCLLLKHGANANQQSPIHGFAPLLATCLVPSKKNDIVDLLLKKNPVLDLNLRTKSGLSALLGAARRKECPQLVRDLLHKGADWKICVGEHEAANIAYVVNEASPAVRSMFLAYLVLRVTLFSGVQITYGAAMSRADTPTSVMLVVAQFIGGWKNISKCKKRFPCSMLAGTGVGSWMSPTKRVLLLSPTDLV